jgi:hypothetical protein
MSAEYNETSQARPADGIVKKVSRYIIQEGKKSFSEAQIFILSSSWGCAD